MQLLVCLIRPQPVTSSPPAFISALSSPAGTPPRCAQMNTHSTFGMGPHALKRFKAPLKSSFCPARAPQRCIATQ